MSLKLATPLYGASLAGAKVDKLVFMAAAKRFVTIQMLLICRCIWLCVSF